MVRSIVMRAIASILCWLIGLGCTVYVLARWSHRLINVVSYETVGLDASGGWVPWVGPILAGACLGWLAFDKVRHKHVFDSGQSFDDLASLGPHGLKPAAHGLPLSYGRGSDLVIPAGILRTTESPESVTQSAALPMLLPVGVVVLEFTGFDLFFIALGMTVFGVAWSIDRLGQGLSVGEDSARAKMMAPVVLGLAILISTAWHAWMQYRFWQHLTLGYADFGLFTTDLEHCLPWKDVGWSRFSDTRMGYHCVPFFYVLAPFYAAWRSPVFLMFVGPFALNLVVVPVFALAKTRSHSSWIALLFGLSWLLLPTISRLPYSNTYGFQSIYLAVPWLAFCFSLARSGRWWRSHVCLCLALLCEETVCGVAFGWGIYLCLWGRRWKDGVVIVAVSIGYLLFTTLVLIPYFSSGIGYSRLELFGAFSLDQVLERLERREAIYYLLALLGPLGVSLWRSWRMGIAVLPPLLLVLMLSNPDYLNIKYWHQSSMLPVLFIASVLGATRVPKIPKSSSGLEDKNRNGRCAIGPVLGIFVSVLLFHQHWGYSPLTQAYRYQQSDARLASPDPRLTMVDHVRSEFSPEQYTVIATERLAAHFIDYRMVWTVSSAPWYHLTEARCLLIVDTGDGWDAAVREKTLSTYLNRAVELGFVFHETSGSIRVLVNESGMRD